MVRIWKEMALALTFVLGAAASSSIVMKGGWQPPYIVPTVWVFSFLDKRLITESRLLQLSGNISVLYLPEGKYHQLADYNAGKISEWRTSNDTCITAFVAGYCPNRLLAPRWFRHLT